ncbi:MULTISPECIES: aminopeptidase P family protein [unclassified Mesorhizobium]|uniref:aminopeptidase P family protein n=1 Tax=unclassified Mesorhizobium TaxID=325217 RepID=UPI000FDB07C7|nr:MULTISPECIES: aminopeptidase P family protein [unclassified Mesorhizobium]TGR41199.1 aminopeptidase P family protein [bacterium M00.F.Ca.ET.199.01.1.1]TGU32065.1 aminopeptidase P family protein [bacterium M00.F.Ca.ET.156.01.1.1]TGV86135.1 aminopeptidase P family protein [Mesorhizobium sp. M00.F.Ca.ET.149.01.1.1]TGR25924.1 aminopeptidase P family protein [Mesorhizobium sp. M8A.F.Ca.ET.197.01.1.1]TGR26374.1 aminopeptidase P family protein [Mesorhizobium sp. M8A.F.Ca.ET.202.01.1.1]
MFQTFDSAGDPAVGKPRVALLRQWLSDNGLDGFIVPRADEHQGEYVADRSARLKWLTGFSGSAGVAIVLRDRAFVFVDGRYTLQVRGEVDLGIFSIESLVDNPPAVWLRDHLGKGARLGFDPWLHTIGEVKALQASADKIGAVLVPLDRNPIDIIWKDQPGAPVTPVELHPIGFAGELAKDKLARLATAIGKEGATHAVLTDPSSIAWAFNIRGGDVPHTPLALGFAILAADGSHQLFMDSRKFSRQVAAYLTQLADPHEPGEFEAAIAALAKSGAKIALDPVLAADRLRMLVEDNGGTVIAAPDPARIPRATKNQAEINGSRAAHRRDGAAVAKLLCWLDRQKPGSLDEIAVVTRLEETRRQTGEETQMPLRDVSFDTISGAGPNGAIMHYRVSRATSRKLRAGELFLLDSGAQYQDGTTDITRTVPIGQPTEEMRERFTLVLKGMIGISTLRFPAGTRGSEIDAVARMALWKHGCDFAHGTGHGVGSYLAVHEGPQRIARTGTEKLLEGMMLSNEPGYYKEGAYGIRIENLILVTPAEQIEGGDIAMHAFETLTLAPIDVRLVRSDLLTRDELHWLDAYHARVAAEIGPMLDGETLAWLEKATAPLPHDAKI